MNSTEWICIKDTDGLKSHFTYGKIYHYIDVYMIDNKSYVSFYGDDGLLRGFYLESPIKKWLKFSDYFTTLAEFREMRINQILEDE
jgi:hypothetical protein